MTRHVFFSFHYDEDAWRTSQVRQMGVLEGDRKTYDNDWESIRKDTPEKIKSWIAQQMKNRSCIVVLVGSNTASREWVRYEICEAWKRDMGVVGVRIHGLKDSDGKTSSRGEDPFDNFLCGNQIFSSVAECFDPEEHIEDGDYDNSIYEVIESNLEDLIVSAIDARTYHKEVRTLRPISW